MKKLIAVVLAGLILGTGFSSVSYADDEGWYVAGGLLGGLILGSALSDSSCHSHYHYYYATPVYYTPVYYYPRPVYRTYTTYTTYTCYPSTTYVEYWY